MQAKSIDQPSDGDLMQAYAAGDASAFETLYDRHALPVWRFVQRSVQDTALADELVQDVWFSVVRQAGRYEAFADAFEPLGLCEPGASARRTEGSNTGNPA